MRIREGFYSTTLYVLLLLVMLIMLMSYVLVIPVAHANTREWPLRQKGEVRYLQMIKVYDIGLYSPVKVDANTILDSNVSKCLRLDYALSLSSDKFRLATTKILKRQHTTIFLNKIKQPLARLENAYKAVKKGDSYTLCYDASKQSLRLALNDKKLIEIKSADLAKAYLGIWLSENKPISMPLYRSFFSITH